MSTGTWYREPWRYVSEKWTYRDNRTTRTEPKDGRYDWQDGGKGTTSVVGKSSEMKPSSLRSTLGSKSNNTMSLMKSGHSNKSRTSICGGKCQVWTIGFIGHSAPLDRIVSGRSLVVPFASFISKQISHSIENECIGQYKSPCWLHFSRFTRHSSPIYSSATHCPLKESVQSLFGSRTPLFSPLSNAHSLHKIRAFTSVVHLRRSSIRASKEVGSNGSSKRSSHSTVRLGQ